MTSMEEIRRKLERYFGEKQIPSPYNYPQTFKWYVTLYTTEINKKKNS